MVPLRIGLIALLGATSSFAAGNNQPSLRRGNDGGEPGNHERNLILGGKERNDRIKSFAFIVTYDESDKKFKQCGGTLVKDDVVLTAAHCVEGAKRPVLVALGAKHAKQGIREDLTAGGKTITDIPGPRKDWKLEHDATHISTVANNKANWVLHKKYGGAKGGFVNDIALIKLDSKAKTSGFMGKNAKIQGLEDSSDDLDDDDTVYAIGHGATDRHNTPSDELKIGKMEVDDEGTACSDSKHFDNNKMICAVNTKLVEVNKKVLEYLQKGQNEKAEAEAATSLGYFGTPCVGDSGGPLFSKDWSGVDTENQVGITSHGANPYCSEWEVFTRVSYYKDWIAEESKSLSG